LSNAWAALGGNRVTGNCGNHGGNNPAASVDFRGVQARHSNGGEVMSNLNHQQLAPSRGQENHFGLILFCGDCVELHGLEITLDGRVVPPELHPARISNAIAGVNHNGERAETALA
jgi:hypothetical protein